MVYMVAIRDHVYSPGPVFAGPAPSEFSQFFPNPSSSLPFLEWSVSFCWSNLSGPLRQLGFLGKASESPQGRGFFKLGIFDAIMMSLNTPPSHKPQISATLMFWCLAEQSFHFRVGAMVPTMMDVVALTGLPWTGETAYAGMSVPDIEYHRPKSAGKPGPAYGTFIDTCMKSDSSISEDISFLSCWLNRYLCSSPTLAMTADFVDLAKVLHSGRRVALAPPLSYLYRGMNEVFEKSVGYFSGAALAIATLASGLLP